MAGACRLIGGSYQHLMQTFAHQSPKLMSRQPLFLIHQSLAINHPELRSSVPTCCGGVLIQQVRFRKRMRPQHKSKSAKKEEAEKKKKKKVVTIVAPKVEVTNPDIKYAGRSPIDNVWIRKYYPTPRYTLHEILQKHREAAVPEIFNNVNGIVYLSCTLDLRTRKKTKFMGLFKDTVVLPHYFKDVEDHRILAFVKSEEDKQIAQEMGAVHYGSVDLIKSIQAGTVTPDDYDHVVCSVDMVQEVTTVRKALRELYPKKENKSLGGDIAGMIKYFTEGKTYESFSTDNEAVGKVEAPIGTLDMYDSQLEENYHAMIESICSHRTPSLGAFITQCTVECPPSDEVFLLEERALLPLSQRKLKVKKLVQDVEPEVEVDSDDEGETVAVKQKG